MLISETVMVRWNGRTRNHYEEKGYIWTKQNDFFECKIGDVMKKSPIKVDVKCDYCGRIHKKEYRNYIDSREFIERDACKNRKCMLSKSEDVSMVKYGVKNYNSTQESKEFKRNLYKTPFREVEELCEQKGLILLSKENEYENDRSPLRVICIKHESEGIQDTNFANIKNNKHCCIHIRPEITSKARKLNGNVIVKEFKNYGLIPCFSPDDYVNNSTPLPYKCPKHEDKGVQYREYANLKVTEGCYYCSKERTKEALKTNHDEVFSHFCQNNLTPLENQIYKNKDEHILYRCNFHPEFIQKTSYSSLKRTQHPCEHCRAEQSISKINRRMRSSLSKWIKDVVKKCDGKCVLTGSDTFDVHHLYSYNNIIKDALNYLNIKIKDEYDYLELDLIKNKVSDLHTVENGACVHPILHIEFHKIYGKVNNTKEQFDEFAKRFYEGEFDSLINHDRSEVL